MCSNHKCYFMVFYYYHKTEATRACLSEYLGIQGCQNGTLITQIIIMEKEMEATFHVVFRAVVALCASGRLGDEVYQLYSED